MKECNNRFLLRGGVSNNDETDRKVLTWSEVVYEGIEVYNKGSIFDSSGFSGSSECVV